MFNPLSFALYGQHGYSAPEPRVTTATRCVKLQGATQRPRLPHDDSPTRLIIDMPTEETVFGRATTAPSAASVIDNHKARATRTDIGMGAWERIMLTK